MSRIGNKEIKIPEGVQVEILEGNHVQQKNYAYIMEKILLLIGDNKFIS